MTLTVRADSRFVAVRSRLRIHKTVLRLGEPLLPLLVPALLRLLPAVPWRRALLVFGPGEPFTLLDGEPAAVLPELTPEVRAELHTWSDQSNRR